MWVGTGTTGVESPSVSVEVDVIVRSVAQGGGGGVSHWRSLGGTLMGIVGV